MGGSFGAHGKLKEINDLRRLAGLVERGLEQIVKLAFVTGFPSEMSTALQQLPGIENMEMSDFLVSARVLAVNRAHDLDVVQMAKEDPIQPEKFRGPCLRCKEPHLISDCKAKEPPQQFPSVTDVVRPYCSILPSTSLSQQHTTDSCQI